MVDPLIDQSMDSQTTVIANTDAIKKSTDGALWVQMHSEMSKEMRDKYLQVNGTSAGHTTSSGKKKKNFTFRRIGSGKYGFVCPLRSSTVRCFSLLLFVLLILSTALSLFFCYLRGWWIFKSSSPKNFGPDPDQYWWQGTTFYEIFPPSFKDSDGDGYGDLEGIIEQVPYLRSLGVSAVRLNSIFAALDYPQRFDNVLNHFAVDPHLGRFQDFLRMVNNVVLIIN